MHLIILVVEKKSAIFQCSLTTYLYLSLKRTKSPRNYQIVTELRSVKIFQFFIEIFFLYFYATLNRDLSSISSMETSANIFIKLIKQK